MLELITGLLLGATIGFLDRERDDREDPDDE